MAFEVEDGSGTSTANSYLSVADFRSYHEDRGQDTTSHSDANVQTALVRATDFLDRRFRFVGEKGSSDQALEWPRVNAYDRNDYLLTGIPQKLKNATAEYALRALSASLAEDPSFSDDTGARVAEKMERIGPITESVKYASLGAYSFPEYPLADSLLRGLVIRGGRIVRA